MGGKRIPNDRTAADDRRCKTCMWHGTMDGIICCEFLLCTGKRRGCKAGVLCTRYVKGDNKHHPKEYEDPDMLRYKPGSDRRNDRLFKPKPKKPKPRGPHTMPINLDAYNAMKAEHSISEVARETGYTSSAINLAAHRGTISDAMAQSILDIFGVDLIQH